MDNRTIPQSGLKFEALCRRLLEALGYGSSGSPGPFIFRRGPGATLREADFIGVDPSTNQPLIAEFKLTLSGRARTPYVMNALSQLRALSVLLPGSVQLLIITCPLDEEWKAIATGAGIEDVWDLAELLSKAHTTSLYGELIEFLEEAGVPNVRRSERVNAPIVGNIAIVETDEIDRPGADICRRITSLGFEKTDWRKYEDLCTDALRHLFGDQFGKVYPQSPSEGNIHRRDLLVRLDQTIISGNP